MKNKIIIIALALGTVFFAACSGDRSPQSGNDTVKNRFGTAKDTTKADTSKAMSNDNSGSGGAAAVKDTSKMAAPKK